MLVKLREDHHVLVQNMIAFFIKLLHDHFELFLPFFEAHDVGVTMLMARAAPLLSLEGRHLSWHDLEVLTIAWNNCAGIGVVEECVGVGLHLLVR